MEKKIQHLTTVLKERIRINKNNSSKLVKLSKEVEVLEEAIRPKKTDSNEIKHL